MDLIFKIAAIGILVGVINQFLIKADKSEQAMMTTLAGLVVVVMLLLPEINKLFALIRALFGL